MYVRSLFFGFVLAAPLQAQPLFENSVVSNNIDFIKTTDKSVFQCLQYVEQTRMEMPDKRHDTLFANDTYLFDARFTDGTSVGIWVHPKFGSKRHAQQQAQLLTGPLGRLPTFMRKTLSHVVVHKGNETAFAEDQGHFFVVYSENMKKRIRTHDLEETVFHESVHATLDAKYARSSAWRKAQRSDGEFITNYGRKNPIKEDLAEFALFGITYLRHPERLPKNMTTWIAENTPNRMKFIKKLFSGPHFQKVGSVRKCN